ncbi:Universal stress protein family [Pseudonocardia sp. Ae168_Ps1]|uniref:universal stress protein n=1 Tax=unclassified Pseudonocardia TaxID=2619320 RepID=UPI0001FFE303|nr:MULTISPECIES: universal stress protein [unclassified Pseudonocardia]OLL72382.1 Universal stress protein family [Pseudonocardia sp. Ae150A_Ps1]OLL78354.1 Universal stress protein family [Pseudonocardia sp. Ae168_Ps1]OLL87520.1 Universal stress protein family [Pseudonocardia sp. Ae263_Ps1]OLL92450.1 Universal stress protein family [Pseudonocardia sp. Ae356_Ps1]OLM18953.1 Universal stress protein family [Pseudonocardia sp. Ae707_Ps1]
MDATGRTGPRPDEIVVGVDGSPTSRTALTWALAEAARSRRWVRAVRVWDPTALFAPPAPVVEMRSTVRHEEQLALEADLAAVLPRAGIRVEGELREEPVVDGLVAASAGAAMLVLGSHGHGPVSRMLLGSVSAACSRRARCPVVIVPARAETPADADVTAAGPAAEV